MGVHQGQSQVGTFRRRVSGKERAGTWLDTAAGHRGFYGSGWATKNDRGPRRCSSGLRAAHTNLLLAKLGGATGRKGPRPRTERMR